MTAITAQPPENPPTLRECYENTYVRLKLRGAATSTKGHYYYSIRYFEKHLGRTATVADLTDDEVGAAMGFIVADDGLGLSNRSANKFRDNILALWRFLARKRTVTQFPDVEPFVEPKRVPVAWTPAQLSKLWRVCDSALGTIGGVPANLWWHGLHALAWDTAERITAMVSVLASDLDLDGGWIVVRAELRKGKRADKKTRLHPDTVAVLRKIVSPDRDRLFPWPFTHSYLWNRYTRLLKLSGLPHDRYHKFHCLRKSAASYFKAAGGDATALLGHSSTAVTEKYLDPTIVGEQYASDVLFRPVESNAPARARAATPADEVRQQVEKAHLSAASIDAGRIPEREIELLDVLDEFRLSDCSSAVDAERRLKRAAYRLRVMFDACKMATAADLAVGPIEGYLRALLASNAATKTVRDYVQDVRMFVRWLVNTKLPFGVRPEFGLIVAIDAVKLIEEHALPTPTIPAAPRSDIKLRGSGPPKVKREVAPFKLGLWTPGPHGDT